MPLTLLNYGVLAVIERFTGSDEIKKHLSDLGFVQGKKVTLFSFDGTNYIIKMEGATYALGRDLAKRIYVKEVSCKL